MSIPPTTLSRVPPPEGKIFPEIPPNLLENWINVVSGLDKAIRDYTHNQDCLIVSAEDVSNLVSDIGATEAKQFLPDALTPELWCKLIQGMREATLTGNRKDIQDSIEEMKNALVISLAGRSRALLEYIQQMEIPNTVVQILEEAKNITKGQLSLLSYKAFWQEEGVPGSTSCGPRMSVDKRLSLLVKVCAFNRECPQWGDPKARNGNDPRYSRFPDSLPFNLLVGKTEESFLEFSMTSHKYRLICFRSLYQGRVNLFEKQLRDSFMKLYEEYYEKRHKHKLNPIDRERWNVLEEYKQKYYPDEPIDANPSKPCPFWWLRA